MTKAEAWGLLVQALSIFGGGAVVTVAVAAFFSKYMADRTIETHKAQLGQETERLKGELAKDMETHKLVLRKREILYNRQLDAATEFIDLHQKMQPRFSHPDKDWYDASEDVALSFEDYESWLENYLRKYGAVLSKKVRSLLDEAILLASTNKFNLGPLEVSADQIKAGGEFMEKLRECEATFLEELN